MNLFTPIPQLTPSKAQERKRMKATSVRCTMQEQREAIYTLLWGKEFIRKTLGGNLTKEMYF